MSTPKQRRFFWRARRAKDFSWDGGGGVPSPGDVSGSVKRSATEPPQPDKLSAIIGSDRIGSDRIGGHEVLIWPASLSSIRVFPR
ncbi:MAG: hypothetical protein F4Z75_09515 [Synechococcus sp. SB0668_bin_15]|nr:hypothetical protein [Synechococcus sp. SB0668_bin_15]MYC48960.1 hypothetical protein [Synechococcus sp. SB0662_bin_14]